MPRNKSTPVKLSSNDNNSNDDKNLVSAPQNKTAPPAKRQKIEHEEIEDDDDDEDYEDEEPDLFQIIAKVSKEDEWESILLDGTDLSETVLRNTAMNSFLSTENISEKQVRQRVKQIQDRERQQIQITKLQQQIMMSQRLQGGILGSFGILSNLSEDDLNEEDDDEFSPSPDDENDSENQNDNQIANDVAEEEEEEELENQEENEKSIETQQNSKKKVTKFQLNSSKAKSNTNQGKSAAQKKRKGSQ
eukprot:CAMPEP_0168569316 /NCGR_PEP_ID=MMETSP0413-20121227/16073_1 /TAXON_ID=136452 /ORGANISM="Filamoeba nolandi, Strain NC-AS-23-1" /LENGTH=246 /DNA_ID=CAMNT_0008601765 /DNA_START=7 /DNA_END=747 /DNA_ORIENTATION=+